VPVIYGGDFENYGLGPHIENLMWISTTFAIGKLAYEFEDDTLLCWSRDGDGGTTWSGGLFCGLSSDPVNHRTEWVHTPFGPHKHLHDYSGHGPDVWTNADGWAEFTFGPNVYGSAQNYVCYAPAGVERAIPIHPLPHNPVGSVTDFSDF
jgi:alpha-amylase